VYELKARRILRLRAGGAPLDMVLRSDIAAARMCRRRARLEKLKV
jgi:hypothetical protein